MALEDDGVYELYLYTIDVYKRLVGVLPLDDCLARFNPQSFSEIGNLELGDEALLRSQCALCCSVSILHVAKICF